MKTLIPFLFTFFMLSLQLLGQTGTINGTVYDKKTQEILPGVTIIVEGHEKGTFTNENGDFSIDNIEPGEYTLIFSFIGYAKKKLENLELKAGQMLIIGRVELEEEAFSLKEITVTPGSFSVLGNGNLSRQILSGEEIKSMAFVDDITRTVARLPGISSTDYSSKFTIRGGEADEVLITLDGMELYDPFHQRDYSGGLFSIVDVETVNSVELMTGGFSAEYGNRLSGVFNMKTKTIQDDKRHTSIGLSLLNARIYTDGKFAKNKGSYLFSARRGILDLIFKVADFTEILPVYYDVMGKMDYQLNDKHLLSFHVLHSGDQTKIRDIADDGNMDKNDMKYNNSYAWLTLKSTYNAQLFSRTLLYSGLITHDRFGSFYKLDEVDKGTFMLTDKRSYSLFGIKQDWNWEASNKVFLNGGFEAKQVNADYDYFMEINELRINSQEELIDYHDINVVQTNPSGQQIVVYLTGRFKVLKRLILETGLRYDYTSYTNDSNIGPRVSLAYALAKSTFLRAAWGYYYQSQFINNLDVNNGNTDFNTAELAKHYVLGLEHTFKNGINFRVEGYYKDLSNVSPSWQTLEDQLEVFNEQRNDYLRVIYNGTTSKGIEFFIKYDVGKKFSLWLSYALAKAEDDIKDIEYDGLLIKRTGNVPRLNDQRHTIYFDSNYRLNEKWSFHLSWQYYVGWPRTAYTYDYKYLPNGQIHFYPVHYEFNGTIYPAYHRMDIRANRHFITKKGNRNTVYLHLINVYNRKNLKKYDLDVYTEDGVLSIDDNGNYVPVDASIYWFPFLPVIGASWEF